MFHKNVSIPGGRGVRLGSGTRQGGFGVFPAARGSLPCRNGREGQAMKQKKRELKEQMKQKTVQMMQGQPEKKMEAEQMGPVKQDKKMETEQPSKNIEDEVKENEK